MSVGGPQPKEVVRTEPSADVLAEIYQINYHAADLLRALLTRDATYIRRDIDRIRLSLSELESKLSRRGELGDDEP